MEETSVDSSPRPTTAPYRWPPQQEAERSRAPEFYGFVAWTSTYLLFVLYILWAILPDEWILRTGVTWYPNREWAILVPAWTVVVVILTYISYWALALRATPAFDDMSAITDKRAQTGEGEGGYNPYLASVKPGAIPEQYDIPIGMLNRVLYHEAIANGMAKANERNRRGGQHRETP